MSQNARTSGSRRSRRAPPPKKNNTPIVIGVAVVVVGAIAVWLATRGGGTNQNGGPGQGTGTTKPTPVKEKTARERYDEHLALSDSGTDKDRVQHLIEAIALLELNQWADAKQTVKGLYEKVVAIDGDNKEARTALGYKLYKGDYQKYDGQWLTTDKYEEVGAEWQRILVARKKKAAEDAERQRWTKDAFAKKARRVADYYIKDVEKVPDLDLVFYFDLPEVPRPYLLMVQNAQSPNPEATAKTLGPGLAALRKTFAEAYGNKVLPNWDNENHVVPVMIFKDSATYERYRDNGHPYFPSTGLAAAFYTSRPLPGMADTCKGTLYVWQGASEAQFNHEVFHEATHQLMHNASKLARMPPTPWLEEGIAEFWGAYKGNRYAGFEFRQFLKGRYPSIQRAAKGYFGIEKTAFMTPKQFLAIDQLRFARAKALLDSKGGTPQQRAEAANIVGNVYALGWAFIFWSHYGPKNPDLGPKGKYAAAFKRIVGLELRYRYNIDRLAKEYGIDSDDDWAAIAKDFFSFCLRDMRKWNNGMPLPDLK